MTMGKRELRQMLTAVLRLDGQGSGGPKTVWDQSRERISAPVSLPPEKISLSTGEVWRTTFPAALMSSPKIESSCPQGQAYSALGRRLLTRSNCFVRLGCEKAAWKGGGSGDKQEGRRQEEKEGGGKAQARRQD